MELYIQEHILFLSQKKSVFYIVTTVLLLVFCFVYSMDLVQKNKESLFLTNSGKQEYASFLNNFKESTYLVIQSDSHLQNISTFLDEKLISLPELKVLTSNNTPKELSQIIKLDRAIILFSEKGDEQLKTIIEQIFSNAELGKIGKEYHLIGVPYTNLLLDRYSKDIKDKLFPAIYLGIFVLLCILLRSFFSTICLYLPCVLSSLISLSFIKFFLGSSNLVNSVVPLLVFVVNLALVLHLYFTAIEFKTFKSALLEKRRPVFLTILTTVIGFSTLYLSDLSAISEFGILTGILIVVTSLISIGWLLAIDSLKRFCLESYDIIPESILSRLKNFFSIKSIIFLFICSIVIGIWSYGKIPILTDANRYFPQSSGMLSSMNKVASEVLGIPLVEIVVKRKKENKMQDLLMLEKLERDLIKEMPEMKVLSLNRLIQIANSKYIGKSQIPSFLISYNTLRSQIPSILREGYPLADDYRITLTGSPINVHEYEKIILKLRKTFEQYGYEYEVNGLYHHLMVAQKNMIATLFKSFSVSLLLISTIALIVFRKIRVFVIFISVNIIPVFISFGLFYILGLSFNIATVMTYSISLGLIVDSSFHILEVLDKKGLRLALYLNTVVKPILITSLVLAICFFMFGFNDFLPIKQFGIALGTIILIGLVFDLKVLPSLYFFSRPNTIKKYK